MKKSENDALIKLLRSVGMPVASPDEAQKVLLSFNKSPKSPEHAHSAVAPVVQKVIAQAAEEAIKSEVAARTARTRLGVCSECEDSHLTVYTWCVKIFTVSGPQNVVIPVKLCKKCGTMYAAFDHFNSFVDSIMTLSGGKKIGEASQ